MEFKKRQAIGESSINCVNIYNISLLFRKIYAIAELQVPQCSFCHEQSLQKYSICHF